MFASIPRWLRIVVFTQIALVFVIPFGGWILQSAGESSDMREFPPPGKMVELDGRGIHLYCVGERGDGPLVVLNADLSDQGLVWRAVQQKIGSRLRSCAVDRAGLGWSDPGPDDRSITATARELYRVLGTAGEEPPYLGVGHGLGALQLAVMAYEHPAEVSGLVLVDPLPADCLKDRFDAILARTAEDSRDAVRERLDAVIAERGACPDGEGGTPLLSWLARIGMIRALAGRNFDPTAPTPELIPVNRALKLRTQATDAVLQESKTAYVGMDKARVALQSLGTLPVQVISKGRMGNFPEDQDFIAARADPNTLAFERAQLRYIQDRQAGLADSLSNATLRIAKGSGHYIPISEPGVVAEAILGARPPEGPPEGAAPAGTDVQ